MNKETKIDVAKRHGIKVENLYMPKYNQIDPEEAAMIIKSNIPGKFLYTKEDGQEIYITMMEAAKMFEVHYTSIRKYILAGFSMNETIRQIKENTPTILAVPNLTRAEENDPKIELNSIGERLRKYAIYKRIPYRAICYLISEKGYSISGAIKEYQENGRSGPRRWKFIINDILLDSFCTKYQLDDKQLRDYLNKSDDDLILSLEKSVFLNIFYTDFDITPKVRAKLLDIYLELNNIKQEERMSYLKTALNQKNEKDLSIIDTTYSYLENKYGFIALLEYYYDKDQNAEIYEGNIREFIEESILDFFFEKLKKITIIKKDLEYLQIRAEYNTYGESALTNLTDEEKEYVLGNSEENSLYSGYKAMPRRNLPEIQLNNHLTKTLKYPERWYY